MTRPSWWNDFLAWVDKWPTATPPFELMQQLQTPPQAEWAASGDLAPLMWILMRPLHADRPKEPIGGIGEMKAAWRDWYDELAERGPPELRARILEVLWSSRRGGKQAVRHAQQAVGAYLEAVPAAKNREGTPGAGHYARRAMSIAAQINDADLVEKARDAAVGLLRDGEALTHQRWIVARGLTDSGADVAKEVAVILEGFVEAELQRAAPNWGWVRSVLLVAAEARRACDDEELAATLRRRAAETHRDQAEFLRRAGASPLLIADCLSRAVRALRDAGATSAAEGAHRDLLRVQRLVPGEMKRIAGETIDLTREGLAAIAAMKDRPFQEQLLVLCALVKRTSVAECREFAKRSNEQFVFQSLVAFQAVDEHGRNAKSASDPTERTMIDYVNVYRQCVTVGTIEPARRQIALDVGAGLDAWVDVLRDRPLVAPTHLLGLARGLAAGLVGDWIVSTSILAPQLEYLLRRLLGEAEELTSTVNADGTQREKLVSELLKKPKLVEILGEDWVYDLATLLVEPGRNLRNRVAHGMVSDAEFHSVESSYLWFLVIEMVLRVTVTTSRASTETLDARDAGS